jgi:Ca2+-binding RTX toxin-like protein
LFAFLDFAMVTVTYAFRLLDRFTLTGDGGATGNNWQPALAATPTGGFWATNNFNGFADVDGWRFAANGNRLGGRIDVNATTTGSQYDSAIAIQSNGRALVAYTDSSAGAGQEVVRIRMFNADGTPFAMAGVNTGDFSFATVGGSVRDADVIALSDGGYALAYRNDEDAISLVKITSDGLVDTGFSVFDQDGMTLPSLAALGAGVNVLVFTQNGPPGSPERSANILAQKFDDTGASVGDPIEVFPGFDNYVFNDARTDVVATGNGGFAVACECWSENPVIFDGYIRKIALNIFFPSGGYTSVEVDEAPFSWNDPVHTHRFPSLTALANGFLLVTWSEGAPGTLDVKGKIYDQSGNVILDEFTLSDLYPQESRASASVTLKDGRVVIAYESDSVLVDGDLGGIEAQIRELTRTTTGDTTANTLTGDALRDLMRGGAGNDVISGRESDDTLVGGTGADALAGGTGRDVFDFDRFNEIGRATGARDRIIDFEQGPNQRVIDRIDLRNIDANTRTTAPGNQAFEFIGTAAFTGNAGDTLMRGELRFQQYNRPGIGSDVTVISGDINGDRIVDFALELVGLHTLTAGSFFL